MSPLAKISVVVGLSLLAACGRTDPDTAPAVPAADPPAVSTPAEDAEAARATELAHRTLVETTRAMTALQGEDVAAAQRHIGTALASLDEIEAAEPSVHVARFLGTAARVHVLEEEVPMGPDDVVAWSSVTKELDLAELPEAVREAHARIQGGDPSLDDLALVGSHLHLHAIALPVASTHTKLLAAKELVDEEELARALDVLDRATLGVRLVDAWVDAPVWEARGEVQEAHNALADGHLAEARARLDAAVPLLAQVDGGGEATPREIALSAALHEEVAAIASSLEAGRVDEAQQGLAGLEHRVWSTAQRVTARWAAARERGLERDALVDTLEHVEWAYSYQFKDPDPDKAALMRERASHDLARAYEAADAATRPVLAGIQRDLAELRETPVTGQDEEARRSFARLVLDLTSLVYDLGGEA